MDPTIVLRTYRGAARRKTLLKKGVTRGVLARAVADGRVVRALYGVYALPDAPRAQILRSAYQARVSCHSMCETLGLPIIKADASVHLWVPRDRARRHDDTRPRDGVVIHRHDHKAPQGREQIAIALDLLGVCHGRLQQIVAIDQALRRGLITRERIAAFSHTPPDQVAWLVARCDPKAQSLIETITRVTLADAGFRVSSQVDVRGVGHVDLVVEGILAVETDGEEHHNNPTAWAEDIRRNNACLDAGFIPVHFTYKDVMFGLAGVVAQVRRLLPHIPTTDTTDP
ncbi:endonuclease domain-containing protein [Demequina soli]|uniref:endonuclease domain-containing protein n=1 Tax=Demequina soli TaxID=1638987 RepID=UPI000784D8AD|nr:type IV toxin-antitoxin system AbiEi family antitoxin domain-containing protein [Demequina soli]